MGKSLTLDNLTWTTVQHILTLFFSLVCTVGPRKDIAGGSGQVGLKSTCHLALNECERDNSCSRYLDQGVYLDTVFVSIGSKSFTSLNLYMSLLYDIFVHYFGMMSRYFGMKIYYDFSHFLKFPVKFILRQNQDLEKVAWFH